MTITQGILEALPFYASISALALSFGMFLIARKNMSNSNRAKLYVDQLTFAKELINICYEFEDALDDLLIETEESYRNEILEKLDKIEPVFSKVLFQMSVFCDAETDKKLTKEYKELLQIYKDIIITKTYTEDRHFEPFFKIECAIQDLLCIEKSTIENRKMLKSYKITKE